MSNYTKSTNFATKDNLTPGDPLKVVRGTEIDTEFNNIATAVATKTDNASAAITGGSITGITDLAVADGGTGASTAAGGLNNLLPSQTGNANKYLQTDGTNATWDAVSLSTADITGTLPIANGGTGTTSTTFANLTTNVTGTLPVANGGTGVTSSTGTGSVVLSNSPTLVTPALGTPASGVATNLTGLPISTGVSGLGTGVATFLSTPSSANLASAVTDETGSGALVFANSPTLVTPALGTPSALVGTNITGTASGLTAGNVTTNANLTGAVTSVGNATSLGSFTSSQLVGALTDETGSGSAVFATSPTLVTPILGTPTSATLTNATGLPLTTGVTGTLPTANGGTNLGGATPFTSGGVVYASSTSALATGSGLTYDGSNLSVGRKINLNVDGVATSGFYNGVAISGYDALGWNGSSSLVFGGYRSSQWSEIQFYTGGSEQMRLNSTGLGIGTSSPAYKLDVSAGSFVIARFKSTSTYGQVVADNTSATGGGVFISKQNGVQSSLFGNEGSILGTSSLDTAILNDVAGGSINLYTAGSATLRFSVNSVGGVKAYNTIGVGNATPSTSGAGITFPATQSASSDANTLDDYEEGTWTPVLNGGWTVVGATTLSGRYTKIGNLVYIEATLAAATSIACAVSAGAAVSGFSGIGAPAFNSANAGYAKTATGEGLGNAMISASGFVFQPIGGIGATTEIVFSGTYRV